MRSALKNSNQIWFETILNSKPWVDFQNHSEASGFLSEDTPSTSSLPKGMSSNITFDSSITQASDGGGVLGGATGVMSTPLLAWIWGDSNGEGISSVFFIPCNGCLPKGGGSIHVRPMQQMQLDDRCIICVYVCHLFVYIWLCIYIYIHTYMRVCVCVCVRICVWVCIYHLSIVLFCLWLFIYIYISIYLFNLSKYWCIHIQYLIAD